MFKKSLVAALVAAPLAIAAMLVQHGLTRPAEAQQPQVQRKVLMTQDLPIPGQQAVMVLVELPAGSREGRHSHPGPAFAYMLEGSLTLDHEGRASATYKAGDSVFIEAGKIHEGINSSGAPAKLVATFVVEKGKPLTTAAQ